MKMKICSTCEVPMEWNEFDECWECLECGKTVHDDYEPDPDRDYDDNLEE